MKQWSGVALGIMVAVPLVHRAGANGVLRAGFGARDAGAAGVFAGTAGDALAAMQTNPAALSVPGAGEWTLSLRGGWARGDYRKAGRRYGMDLWGGFPELGAAWRPSEGNLTFGVSAAPLAASRAEWTYPDAPGGIGGISYGPALSHDSGFSAIRMNAGVAWRIDPRWSIGASLGAVHSRVDFDAPFIFQTNPALAGAKVNLDLETDGWEPMGEFGVLWSPNDCWRVGVHYRPQVELELSGEAAADFSAQLPPLGLGGTPAFASYRARTRNALPAVAGCGVWWQPDERWTAGLSVDWIGWSRAFDDLEVGLSGGSNPAINGAIGSNVSDRVPVRWRDTWVIGLGSEYALSEHVSLRGGWRWGRSPVSSTWATPLNASLLEHTVALGVGWRREDWRIDLSYEYQFGSPARVTTSGYRAGEYGNSKIDFDAHVVGLGFTRIY